MDSKLLESIAKHYEKELPFVVYATPNASEITLLLQDNATLHLAKDFRSTIFAFAPFDTGEDTYCIPVAHSQKHLIPVDLSVSFDLYRTINFTQTGKDAYTQLVEKAVTHIKTSKVKKIVTSRKFEVSIPSIDLSLLLQNLFASNPNTLRYVWFHPKTGLWAGATPELLLHFEENCVTTMALAGTQKNATDLSVVWSEKEKKEHQYVIDSIVKRLHTFLSVMQVSKTYDYVAGLVVHLRTDIKGAPKNGKVTFLEIANKLHPTPAVCGTPRKKAKKFLMEYENYDRSFYTGFLGPVEITPGISSLYVNLRCMQLQEDKAVIYVGSGITKHSDPLAEWEETNNKSKTMLQVLGDML